MIEEYEAKDKVKKSTAASGKWREDFHGVDIYCLGPSKHLSAPTPMTRAGRRSTIVA